MNDEQQAGDSYRRSNRYYYGRAFPGVWLIIVGGLFLLNNFGYLNYNVWGKLWPVFIIVPGIFMLLRPRRRD